MSRKQGCKDSAKTLFYHLFDDWTSVQICRRVVRRSADDFHAARVRLVVRLGPHKRRKKAVHRKTKNEAQGFITHRPQLFQQYIVLFGGGEGMTLRSSVEAD